MEVIDYFVKFAPSLFKETLSQGVRVSVKGVLKRGIGLHLALHQPFCWYVNGVPKGNGVAQITSFSSKISKVISTMFIHGVIVNKVMARESRDFLPIMLQVVATDAA